MEKELKEIITKAANDAGFLELVDFDVDLPPTGQKADFATNIALIIAGEKKQNPKEIADKISSELSKSENIKEARSAGPGFINIVLHDHTYYDLLEKLLSEKDNFGKSNVGQSKTASIDFVSANPTGPLHIGNARGGPIGETISNLLEYCGYKVIKEFYLNDIGVQVTRLGETIYWWIEKENGNNMTFPDNGYPGEYVKEISSKILSQHEAKINAFKDKKDVIDFLKKEGLTILIDQMKGDVKLLGLKFDKWVSENELQQKGFAEKVVERLKQAGVTAKKEGALWFVNPSDPKFEDKESVLQKSDEGSTFTYFSDDVAYHMARYDENVDLIVDVWGANHHGHIARMYSALKALGVSEEKLKIYLYQYIRLKNGEEIMKMSKRFGNFVTLRQVIEGGVSADAFKYFILAQNPNTPFDFDIKLATEKSEKNPVFYIQYAHARICSILRKAGDIQSFEGANLSLLKNEKELALVKALAMWPDIVEDSLKDFQVQILPHFAYKLASLFHDFYTNCPVLDSDKETKKARLALIYATKILISNVLSICGISAPEKM
jgi:arginyl-tRNA synthetase